MSEARVDITFFDTTLRDGAQALPEANQFPDGTKAEIADLIASLGIGVIEAGFPQTSGDAPEVYATAAQAGNTKYSVKAWSNGKEQGEEEVPPIIAGLCRTMPEDIDAAWGAVSPASRPRIHTFVSTDSEHMKFKLQDKTPEEVLNMGRNAIKYARTLTGSNPRATIEFSAETASTTEETYLERVVKTAIDEGADVINLPDTVGQRRPIEMFEFYKKAIRWVIRTHPHVVISAHNHNDLDMSTANSLSLVEAAAEIALETGQTVHTQIEATLCGLGERAGNTDIFPVVASLFKFSERMPAPINWRFNPVLSVDTAQAVLKYAGLEVDRQSPIVGKDTNVHRSGIHSDGIIKGGHRIYTPFDPTFWGHAEDARHEDGKYQGKRGRQAINGT